MDDDRRAARIESLCVVVAALLVHAVTLRNGFTVDDAYLVVGNTAIRDLANVPSFFTSSWGGALADTYYAQMNAGYYRPLTMVLQALEHAVFGLSPLGFHAVSVALHALATGAALSLARCLLPGSARFGPAFVCALLFAVHPVHAEPVNPATYQSTLLAALLALLALRIWVAGRSPRHGAASAVVALLAVLAKEEAAVVPFLVLAYELLVRRAEVAPRVERASVVAYVASIGTYAAMRVAAVHGSGMSFFGDAPITVRIYTMLEVVLLDARLLLVPSPLCPFYDWYVVPFAVSPLEPGVLAGLGIALVVPLGVFALVGRGERVAAFALAFVPVALLPVMQIIPILNVAAERFLYLPSFGACLLAGCLVGRRPRLRPVVVLVAIVFAGLSVRRDLDWRDDTTLNLAYARDFPVSPTPHLNLADLALARGSVDGAIEELARARALDPQLNRPWIDGIRLLRSRGRDAEARDLAARALAGGIDPQRVASALRTQPAH